MPNFKVGDRVTYAREDMTVFVPVGSVGNILKIVGNRAEVNFKDCQQTVSLSSLDLLSKFSVGQIYKVGELSGQHQWENAIVKLTATRPYGFVVKAIRGKAPDEFAEHCEYARSLTLLTGKQIGEAIKAYDEKKTGGVKEVKRAAKPGEYIKITNPWYNRTITEEDYKKGEILKVRGTQSDGNVLIEGLSDCKFINPIEYVVLEGYSPVKEVKRRAKVGEYLKVVDASVTRDYNYSNGDILKCTFIGSCGVQAKLGAKYGTLVDHEYVVLEGYKPDSEKQPTEEKRKAKVGDTIRVLCDNGGPVIAGSVWKVEEVSLQGTLGVRTEKNGGGFAVSSTNYVVISSGKHVWTPEEVEKSKTIVLDTIRKIYEESKGSVVLSRDVKSDRIYSAYLIEKGYSTLGYSLLGDNLEAHNVRRGTAKCSDTDEPNEWIGKCVALCKVLHKPIPSFIMGN